MDAARGEQLGGRIAIVTGAGRRQGIGAAICRALAAAGADICFTHWQAHDDAMPWGAEVDGPRRLRDELLRFGVRCEAPFFTPRERAALSLAEAMTNLNDGHVPDGVYAEAAGHFDAAELSRLIWWIAIVNLWNRIAVTTRAVPGTYRSRRQS